MRRLMVPGATAAPADIAEMEEELEHSAETVRRLLRAHAA
jgi:hypothetical protein